MINKKSAFSLLLAISLSFVVGCENSIEPFGKEHGLYSIYGMLDLRAETNFIRIKDLKRTLLQDTTLKIDATVLLQDLNRELTDTLKDSIVIFNQVKTHNFYTEMNIFPDTRYRITVTGSKGQKVFTETMTPAIANTNIGPSFTCTFPVRLSFSPVENRNDIRLTFGFNYNNRRQWVIPKSDVLGSPHSFQDNNNLTEIFTFTPKQILDLYPTAEGEELWCHKLDDNNFYVKYTHYGPDTFEDVISDSIRIPGGIGRFGSFYRDTLIFQVGSVKTCKYDCD